MMQQSRPRRGSRRDSNEPRDDFEQKLIELARVTRVVSGGKRMRFRACIVLGDRKGRIGYGLAKGPDVQMAIQKAVAQARKRIVTVPTKDETIPHAILHKYRAAQVMLKPAPRGTGVKAGGAIRIVLDIAGIQNIVAKMLGSKNKMNNVKATIDALSRLQKRSRRLL